MFTTDSFDWSMPFGSSLMLQSCIHSVSVIATASRGRISLGGDLDALRPDIATPGRRSGGGEGARNGLKRRPGNFTTPGVQQRGGGPTANAPPLPNIPRGPNHIAGAEGPQTYRQTAGRATAAVCVRRSARTVCYV